MGIKTVCMTMHPGKSCGADVAARVIAVLKKAGTALYVDPSINNVLGTNLPEMDVSKGLPPCDVLLALGGDGTLLRAVQHAVEADVPLLGINMGRVGFLTEIEQNRIEEDLHIICSGEYLIEERMLLSVRLNDGPEMLVLNDAVVNRGARLVAIDAYISDDLIGHYIADGMIVSSPTGSTGYSLSAGGPIVSPDVRCIVVSPICAHTLQHRPVVVDAKETVRLQLDCDEGQGIYITLDGQKSMPLDGKDTLYATGAKKTAKLIRLEKPHFFTLVRKKLTEWSC